MGIFRYYRFLVKKYPNIYTTIQKHKTIPRNTLSFNDYKVECVLFDLNALIHPCFQKVFNYGSDVEESLFFKEKKMNMSYNDLEDMAIRLLTKKIEEIVYYTHPTKCINIAIDGVAGASKSHQQRQRRFKNPSFKSPYGFNPNNITAGTELLNKICEKVFSFILLKKKYEWKNIKVILNNMYVAGEGEAKLKQWVELQNYNSVTIVSPDADVIMLSLTLNIKEVYVFRENIFKDIHGDYYFVNINVLKEYILNDIRFQSLEVTFNDRMAIRDYVFFSFFIGNDFLHTIPSLDIRNNTFDVLYKNYVDNCMVNGWLINESPCRRNERIGILTINKKSFIGLLEGLAKIEASLLLSKTENKVTWPDKCLMECVIRDNGKSLNFPKYRNLYYEKKFGFDPNNELMFERRIKDVVQEYIIGLTFVLRYYFKFIPTYHWYYPYHYSPLLFDLCKYAKEVDFNVKFDVKPALNIYESLFSILPPSNWDDILPRNISEHLKGNMKLKMDADFVEEFEVDLEGKLNEYEGVALLPFVTYDKIKRYMEGVEYTVDQQERMKSKIYNF